MSRTKYLSLITPVNEVITLKRTNSSSSLNLLILGFLVPLYVFDICEFNNINLSEMQKIIRLVGRKKSNTYIVGRRDDRDVYLKT